MYMIDFQRTLLSRNRMETDQLLIHTQRNNTLGSDSSIIYIFFECPYWLIGTFDKNVTAKLWGNEWTEINVHFKAAVLWIFSAYATHYQHGFIVILSERTLETILALGVAGSFNVITFRCMSNLDTEEREIDFHLFCAKSTNLCKGYCLIVSHMLATFIPLQQHARLWEAWIPCREVLIDFLRSLSSILLPSSRVVIVQGSS